MTATGLACGSCGTELRAGDKFCHECAAPVVAAAKPAEYKQVTVLFADVVHSMDIAATVGAERLREIMAQLVDRATAVVKQFGGTVDKFTGDGIMAVFGAPLALEDHAVRACLAALGIQDETVRLGAEVKDRDGIDLRLRVGLNSGQVIVGEIGSSALGYTTIGEQVGMAQRMESVAPPGGVMLSESTARLVDGTTALGEPELVHIRGSDEPVRVRRLVAVSAQPGSIGPSGTRLVGRQWELNTVAAMLDRSVSGQGCVVGVAGPAGIGKSRLVREGAAIARGRGINVFSTFCESHASDVPFHVAARLLRDAAGITDLDHAAARAQVRARIGDAGDEDVLLLYDLLGIRDPAVAVPNIDPDARRRRLTALINSMSLARTAPAVYVIEDAHWIDEVSESLFADFLTVIPQTHSMVLITYRPEYRGALAQVHGAQTLSLAPLSDSETTALLDELLGSDPSVAGVKALIAGRAAGNPFFAQEIVRGLAERGVLEGERGAYICDADVADVSVPATLQAAIAARIDRLDADAKQTLNAAAVVGLRFTVELLAALGTDPVLDPLVRAELVDQVRFTPSAEYAFHHPLIRTVAYESQLKVDRAALHRQLAAAIESRGAAVDENAALIAEHLEAAGDLRAAYGWHMRSGAWSQSRDVAAALVSWERAARIADVLPADDADRLAMRIAPRTRLCANGWRSHKPIAGKRFEELQDLCAAAGDKASVAIATTGLLGEHLMNGRVAEASRLVSEYMVLIESIGDPTLTVRLALLPIAVKISTGELAEALRWSDMVIDLAEGDPARGGYIRGSLLASAYALRCTARWALGYTGWRDDFNRAVAMARDADPLWQGVVIAYTYSLAIGCGVIAADDAALHDVDEALQGAKRSADDIALGFALYTKAVALLHRDSAQRERGLDLCRQLREMAVDGRFYPTHVQVTDVWIAEEMIRRGDRDAVPLLRASVDALYSSEQLGYWLWGTGVLVEALLEGGTDSDVQEVEAAVDRLSTHPMLDGWAWRDLILLRLQALLARTRGDEVAYRDFADRYRDMATSLGFEGHIKSAEAMP